MNMKDTHILAYQFLFLGIGATLLILGAFVFMNKSQVQYVLPCVMAGIVVSIGPTMILPLMVDRVISTSGDKGN